MARAFVSVSTPYNPDYDIEGLVLKYQGQLHHNHAPHWDFRINQYVMVFAFPSDQKASNFFDDIHKLPKVDLMGWG